MNLAFIRSKYFNNIKAFDINHGDCFRWAWIVKKLYPHAELWSTVNCTVHAFVKIGNKFYDAERPAGVLKYDRLPWFVSHNICREFSEEEYLKHWSMEGVWSKAS